eukprot:1113892_1
MEEMNHMINNAQVLQPTTNGEGELEDNQVTGNNSKKKDGNDSDTEMSQPDIVTVHLPAMKQSMYKPDPYKTLDYIMSGENVQEYEKNVVPSAASTQIELTEINNSSDKDEINNEQSTE